MNTVWHCSNNVICTVSARSVFSFFLFFSSLLCSVCLFTLKLDHIHGVYNVHAKQSKYISFLHEGHIFRQIWYTLARIAIEWCRCTVPLDQTLWAILHALLRKTNLSDTEPHKHAMWKQKSFRHHMENDGKKIVYTFQIEQQQKQKKNETSCVYYMHTWSAWINSFVDYLAHRFGCLQLVLLSCSLVFIIFRFKIANFFVSLNLCVSHKECERCICSFMKLI